MKAMMRNLIVAAVAAAFLLPACGDKPVKEGGKGALLARVDGIEIREADLDREVKALPANLQPLVKPVMESPTGRFMFLDRLIMTDLLVKEAYKRGLDKSPEVEAKMRTARRDILLQALQREVADKAPGLSDDAMKALYEKNKESFKSGERVKASHVLYQSKAEADAALAKAKKGMPFEALMKEARDGGGNAADLGFIERGNFVEEFEKAAFAAPVGQPTGPVKTRYGWHVLLVSAKKAAGYEPFEAVKDRMREGLKESAQRAAIETLVTGLKAKAKVDDTPARKLWKLPDGDLTAPHSKGEAPPPPPPAPSGK